MVIFVKESLRSLKKLAILYYIVTQFNHVELYGSLYALGICENLS